MAFLLEKLKNLVQFIFTMPSLGEVDLISLNLVHLSIVLFLDFLPINYFK